MQWVRFSHETKESGTAVNVGTLEGEKVHVYTGHDILHPGQNTGKELSLADVRLLAPLEPRSIVALWNNFHERAQKEGQQIPSFPLYFMKPTSSVIGPGDTVLRPLGKNHDDGEPTRVIYEAELGVVIGKECKDVSEAEAADYVFGYTCVNDVTAPRILTEFKSKMAFQQWSRSKGYDTFTPLGPAVITDIDPSGLQIKAVLDGETMQDYPVR